MMELGNHLEMGGGGGGVLYVTIYYKGVLFIDTLT